MEDLEFLDTLRETFFEEADDLLSKVEVLFLELENDLSDLTSLESIFRYIHTLKGSAKSVNFRDFGTLAHDVENVLVKLKAKELLVSKEIVDVLLASNDALITMISELKHDREAMFDSTDLRDRLNYFFVKACLQDGEMEAKLPESENPSEENDSSSEHLVEQEISESEDEVLEDFVPMVPPSSNETKGGMGFFDDEPEMPAVHPMVQEVIAQDEPAKKMAELKSIKKSSNSDDNKKNHSGAEEFIRLPIKKLDSLLNTFGEQVILQSILEHNKEDLIENAEMIKKTINQLSKITLDLQHSTMSLRMVRVKGLFNKIQRLARDTANSVDKKVKVNFKGENTEIDKSLADELSIAITHIIRNAIDHGIEIPEERKAANKEEAGQIYIEAYQDNGFFFLNIKDDGKGLNRERILSSAIEKGLVPANAELTDQEVFHLIFKAGFSTAANVTDISGRGVGMDAVKNVVTDAKGEIHVDSAPGQGTQIMLKLPLSMTIFNGTIVRTDDEKFIVPNSDIREVFQFNSSQVRHLDTKEKVVLKGDTTISLLDFDRAIGRKSKNKDGSTRKTALLVKRDGQYLALEVDEIIGQQRVVLKKVGNEVQNIPGVSGGAILADGKVALVLNVNAIAC